MTDLNQEQERVDDELEEEQEEPVEAEKKPEGYNYPPLSRFLMMNGAVFLVLAYLGFKFGWPVFSIFVGVPGIAILGAGVYLKFKGIDITPESSHRK
ncbi:MAG TPA: hypothetical protein GXZ96_03895 [Firmicutes bacterium]|jgi:hypothetical protein|nr:hypothetical protein [Bacillota bacterium]